MLELDVAVGILYDPTTQKVLIATRPEGKYMPGVWEFPGGKLEPNETAFEALCRELKEELNIVINSADNLCEVEEQYPDRLVRLKVFISQDHQGLPVPLEGQQLKWEAIANLDQYTFPSANYKILPYLEKFK